MEQKKLDLVSLVKKRLWQYDIRAKDISFADSGFDLIVQGKYRVLICALDEGVRSTDFDVLCVVVDDSINPKEKTFYFRPMQSINEGNTKLRVGDMVTSENILADCYTKKPRDVFNK